MTRAQAKTQRPNVHMNRPKKEERKKNVSKTYMTKQHIALSVQAIANTDKSNNTCGPNT